METDIIIQKHQNIQNSILDYLDDESNNDFDSISFQKILGNDFLQNRNDFKLILYLLAKISNNHHRSSHFFTKIEKILKSFKQYIIENYSSSEIVDIFKRNKRIILFLYNEKIIKIEDFADKSIKYGYSKYFIPELLSQFQTIIQKNEFFDEISKKFIEFYNFILCDMYPKSSNFSIFKTHYFNSNSKIVSIFKTFVYDKIEPQIENFIKYLIFCDYNDLNNSNSKDKNSVFDMKVIESFSHNYLYQFFYTKLRNFCCDKDFEFPLFESVLDIADENNSKKYRDKNIYEDFYEKMEHYLDEEDERSEIYCSILSFIYNVSEIVSFFYSRVGLPQTITNDFLNPNKSSLLYQKIYSKIISFTDEMVKLKEKGEFSYQKVHDNIKEFLDDVIESNFELNFDDIFKKLEQKFNEMNSKLNIEDIDEFKMNRLKGENETYLCKLIRDDSIEEFISYINKTNISPSNSMIKKSIFETNSFLNKKNPTLIEYAAFFGSIQIFQYLIVNHIEMTSSLWKYAIHGRNPEIIHILEENHVEPEDSNYCICLFESIKCHNNEIANYIKTNYIDEKSFSKKTLSSLYIKTNDIKIDILGNKKSKLYKEIEEPIENTTEYIVKNLKNAKKCLEVSCICSYNFDFFPNNWLEDSVFYYLCRYNYCTFVERILKTDKTRKSINIFNSPTTDNLKYAIRISAIKNNLEIVQLILNSLFTEIVPNLFYECSLTTIVIPSSICKIGNNAFKNSSIQYITIPSSVKSIEDYAFCECTLLMQLKIPSSVNEIGKFAFSKCSSLKYISIPSSVTSIGDFAFNECYSIMNISIPSSVTKIGNKVFNNCPLINVITLP